MRYLYKENIVLAYFSAFLLSIIVSCKSDNKEHLIKEILGFQAKKKGNIFASGVSHRSHMPANAKAS